MTHTFQLKQTALLLALAAAYPLQAHAAAGIAQFTAGDVQVRKGAANSQPLVKGGNIESGDAIETGSQGRAQIRFSDGGMVSLAPNSQFKIDNYADQNDPKQDKFLVDLLRGGMRAITGLIGKRNRDNYKVTTTTATIGIRGSGFNLAYNPDGTLSVSTELDAIEVCNKGGCVGLTAGESALVKNANDAPSRTSTSASIPTPPPERAPVVVGDATDGNGKASYVPPKPSAPLTPTPPDNPVKPVVTVLSGLALTSSALTKSASDQRLYTDGSLVLDAKGEPNQYLAAGNAANGTRPSTATFTSVSSTGSVAGGDYLLLGNWSASDWTGAGAASLAGSAFVVGTPTASTALSGLSGQRGSYEMVKSTAVFTSATTGAGTLTSGSLTADFLGVGNYVDVKLAVRMPGGTAPPLQNPVGSTLEAPQFVGPVVNSPAAFTDYTLRGSGTGTGSGFSGALSVSSAMCLQSLVNCGVGSFNGFFGGSAAGTAGVSYAASSSDHGNFGGAATFAQTGKAATAVTTLQNVSSLAFSALFIDGKNTATSSSTQFSNYPSNNIFDIGEGVATFKGDQLTKLTNAGTTVQLAGSTPTGFGSVGKSTESDFVGWGYWASSTYSSGGGYSAVNNTLADVHYIVGTPTPSSAMPITGTASYGLIGGTAPTFTPNGTDATSQIGTLLSAAMTVDFGTSKAGINIATKFGATTVNMAISASESGYINALRVNGNRLEACGTTAINGIFTGNAGYRAGLTYRSTQTIANATGNLSGALALQQTSSSGLGQIR